MMRNVLQVNRYSYSDPFCRIIIKQQQQQQRQLHQHQQYQYQYQRWYHNNICSIRYGTRKQQQPNNDVIFQKKKELNYYYNDPMKNKNKKIIMMGCCNSSTFFDSTTTTTTHKMFLSTTSSFISSLSSPFISLSNSNQKYTKKMMITGTTTTTSTTKTKTATLTTKCTVPTKTTPTTTTTTAEQLSTISTAISTSTLTSTGSSSLIGMEEISIEAPLLPPSVSIKKIHHGQKKTIVMEDHHQQVDNSNTSSSIESSSSIPIIRTKEIIQQLVAKRVRERDQWTIQKSPCYDSDNNSNNNTDTDTGSTSSSSTNHNSSLGALYKFLTNVLPKLLQIKHPTQEILKEHFPLHPMNWEQIRSYNNNNTNKKNHDQKLSDNPDDTYHHDTIMIRDNNTSNTNNDNNDNNDNNETIQVTWLGHSSLLVQMDHYFILTDPIFSLRCSPSQYFGPKRYHDSPPCTIQEMLQQIQIQTTPPPNTTASTSTTTSTTHDNKNHHNNMIHVVLISHNHYDHLDYDTIKEVVQYYESKNKNDNNNNRSHPKELQRPIFVVPLGLRSWFHDYISPNLIIYEMDWYEEICIKIPTSSSPHPDDNENNNNNEMRMDSFLTITCLPMRHWSNRIGDRDQTLWCGYKVVSSSSSASTTKTVSRTATTTPTPTSTTLLDVPPTSKITTKSFLFTGDTAWFDEMETILGQQYGPYDVAAIPIGAYEPREFMKSNHINPIEAVVMKHVTRSTYAVPIHYGTFPLTTESLLEPSELLSKYMIEYQEQQEQEQLKQQLTHVQNNDPIHKSHDDNDNNDEATIVQQQQDEKILDPKDTFVPWYIGQTKRFPCSKQQQH